MFYAPPLVLSYCECSDLGINAQFVVTFFVFF